MGLDTKRASCAADGESLHTFPFKAVMQVVIVSEH